MVPSVHKTIKYFADRALHLFPVKQDLLFGSRGRGDENDESDVDVAVTLSGEPGACVEMKLALSDLALDALLEHGLLIQVIPSWERQWQAPDSNANPAIHYNIAPKGIPFETALSPLGNGPRVSSS